jgi:hypothetical protein
MLGTVISAWPNEAVPARLRRDRPAPGSRISEAAGAPV